MSKSKSNGFLKFLIITSPMIVTLSILIILRNIVARAVYQAERQQWMGMKPSYLHHGQNTMLLMSRWRDAEPKLERTTILKELPHLNRELVIAAYWGCATEFGFCALITLLLLY